MMGTQGRGHVVRFGFRPEYRGQTEATLPRVWESLRRWRACTAMAIRSRKRMRASRPGGSFPPT
jgi:hypothetical protein